MADILVKQNRIISVFREVVPEQYHQEILDRLEGKNTRQIPLDVDDDAFGPLEFAEEDDDNL